MAKYRARPKRQYQQPNPRTVPLTRWATSWIGALRYLENRTKAKFKHVTECGFCGQETLHVYEDPRGEYMVCTNPKCENYDWVSYSPKKGGP